MGHKPILGSDADCGGVSDPIPMELEKITSAALRIFLMLTRRVVGVHKLTAERTDSLCSDLNFWCVVHKDKLYEILGDNIAAQQDTILGLERYLTVVSRYLLYDARKKFATRRKHETLAALGAKPNDDLDASVQAGQAKFSRARSQSELSEPEQEARLHDLQKQLEDVLATMSDDHCVTAKLHYHEGLKYIEIAETLSISVGTVKSRMAKVREALKSLEGSK